MLADRKEAAREGRGQGRAALLSVGDQRAPPEGGGTEQRQGSSEGASRTISADQGFTRGLSRAVGGHQGGRREPGLTGRRGERRGPRGAPSGTGI